MHDSKVDKDRLKKDISSHFNRHFDAVLSIVQLVVKGDYQYQNVRAKILRSGNNTLREVLRDIDRFGTGDRAEHDEKYDVD